MCLLLFDSTEPSMVQYDVKLNQNLTSSSHCVGSFLTRSTKIACMLCVRVN